MLKLQVTIWKLSQRAALQENKQGLWNTADEDVFSRGCTEWTDFADSKQISRIVLGSVPSMKHSLLHKTGNVEEKKQSPEP